MTPELPRAPISEPCEMATVTWAISAAVPSSRLSSSATTESAVMAMFDPVSPSGTG